MTRAKFDDICDSILKRLIPPMEIALKDAKLDKNKIDEIIMVGGSTRIDKVRKMISRFFNEKPLNFEVHPDEAVAGGAAIQAAILNGDQCKSINDIFLLDVVPLSLGINVSGGIMSVLIKKNTTIPF